MPRKRLSPVIAGFFTAACVFAGSMLRPVGGTIADRIGGIRTLSIMYCVAGAALVLLSFKMPSVYGTLFILLIAMGVVRLLEVLAYAAGSKPLPTKGFSGGEIFLVILVVIIGTGMYQARKFDIGGHFPPWRRPTLDMFGESFDYQVAQQKVIG